MADKSVEQRLEELEKRVRVSEDIEQIKQLHSDYQDAWTSGDKDAQKQYFAEDAIFEIVDGFRDMTLKGREQIFAPREESIPEGMEEFAKDMTEVGFALQPRITVDGDQATGNWANFNLMASISTNQPKGLIHANYDCKYAKQNGVWKIKHLRVLVHFGAAPAPKKTA